MKRTCKQCGKEFELSESEIKFYKSKGLELPKRCQSCRNQNKGASGHLQMAVQERDSEKSDRGAGGALRNNRKNDNGRNNKNYFVAAIAAVLMLLAVFLVKNFFLADSSERLLVSDDVTESNIQSEQEATNETLVDVVSDTSDEEHGELQSLPSENEGSSQGEEQSRMPESTDEEPASQAQDALPQEEQSELRTQQDTQSGTTSQTVPETSVKSYKFRKAQYLTEHFQKHGEEFAYTSEEEYLQGANDVINNPDALHKLEAEDGDDIYYVENTNEFVVVSTDGFIRTYFKASIDYYNRQ